MSHIQVHIQAGEHGHAGAHGQVEVLGEEPGQGCDHDQSVLMNTVRMIMYFL